MTVSVPKGSGSQHIEAGSVRSAAAIIARRGTDAQHSARCWEKYDASDAASASVRVLARASNEARKDAKEARGAMSDDLRRCATANPEPCALGRGTPPPATTRPSALAHKQEYQVGCCNPATSRPLPDPIPAVFTLSKTTTDVVYYRLTEARRGKGIKRCLGFIQVYISEEKEKYYRQCKGVQGVSFGGGAVCVLHPETQLCVQYHHDRQRGTLPREWVI